MIFQNGTSHRFRCTGCSVDTREVGEYYSLREAIWFAANYGTRDGMKCLTCVEEVLGRCLTHADFTYAPVNFRFPMSKKMFQILLPLHESYIQEIGEDNPAFVRELQQENKDRVDRMGRHPELELIM